MDTCTSGRPKQGRTSIVEVQSQYFNNSRTSFNHSDKMKCTNWFYFYFVDWKITKRKIKKKSNTKTRTRDSLTIVITLYHFATGQKFFSFSPPPSNKYLKMCNGYGTPSKRVNFLIRDEIHKTNVFLINISIYGSIVMNSSQMRLCFAYFWVNRKIPAKSRHFSSTITKSGIFLSVFQKIGEKV